MRKIIVPVAVTAAAAGGAAALWLGPAFAGAQTTSTTTPAATAPAVTPAKDGPMERALAKLVANGTITRTQADKVAAALRAEMPLRGPGGPGGPGFGHHFGGLTAASTYLGMTEAELRTALQSGKTLAQVAESKSKSVSGLITAMVKEATDRLDEAVAAGKLTAAQATEITADLKARITEHVNNGMPAGPPRGGGRFRHGGGPGPWGPPPAPAASTTT